jgi:hypothetical protein
MGYFREEKGMYLFIREIYPQDFFSVSLSPFLLGATGITVEMFYLAPDKV